MTNTTAAKTISILREIFACYRIPCQLVLDNGPQFVSEEFQQFMSVNGVKKNITCRSPCWTLIRAGTTDLRHEVQDHSSFHNSRGSVRFHDGIKFTYLPSSSCNRYTCLCVGAAVSTSVLAKAT